MLQRSTSAELCVAIRTAVASLRAIAAQNRSTAGRSSERIGSSKRSRWRTRKQSPRNGELLEHARRTAVGALAEDLSELELLGDLVDTSRGGGSIQTADTCEEKQVFVTRQPEVERPFL